MKVKENTTIAGFGRWAEIRGYQLQISPLVKSSGYKTWFGVVESICFTADTQRPAGQVVDVSLVSLYVKTPEQRAEKALEGGKPKQYWLVRCEPSTRVVVFEDGRICTQDSEHRQFVFFVPPRSQYWLD